MPDRLRCSTDIRGSKIEFIRNSIFVAIEFGAGVPHVAHQNFASVSGGVDEVVNFPFTYEMCQLKTNTFLVLVRCDESNKIFSGN